MFKTLSFLISFFVILMAAFAWSTIVNAQQSDMTNDTQTADNFELYILQNELGQFTQNSPTDDTKLLLDDVQFGQVVKSALEYQFPNQEPKVNDENQMNALLKSMLEVNCPNCQPSLPISPVPMPTIPSEPIPSPMPSLPNLQVCYWDKEKEEIVCPERDD